MKQDARISLGLEDLLRTERLSRFFSLSKSRDKVKSLLGGKHASSLRGRGMDFEEVRNYVPGDDIRNIDWKVTARTKKTHSKVFSEEKEKPSMICLDQSPSMFFGSTYATKSVLAAQLAAAISFRVIKEGDRVGGMVFGKDEVDLIYPKRDRRNLLRFFERISLKNRALIDGRSSDDFDFEGRFKSAISKLQNLVTHDFLIVIISDFYRYSPSVLKSFKQLSLHNDLVLIQVRDDMEKSLPSERFVIGSENLQLEIDGKSDEIRQAQNKDYQDRLSEFSERLKKLGIPLLHFSSNASLEDQIRAIR